MNSLELTDIIAANKKKAAIIAAERRRQQEMDALIKQRNEKGKVKVRIIKKESEN